MSTTPRKTLRVPSLSAPPPPSRPQIPLTPLTTVELANASDIWDSYVKTSYLTNISDLVQLLDSLQVPLQPISRKVCEEEFKSTKARFSARDFISLLERLKTLHSKWLHKLRGKSLDDDLLEAFVAVGGGSDSHGQVDLTKMRNVVDEFHLKVDIDKIVSEMDNDGNASIDFGEFASLIREESGKHKKINEARRAASKLRDTEDEDDLFNLTEMGAEVDESGAVGATHGSDHPITLSSMMYVDEDSDQALLFPPLGLTSRKDVGELSQRGRRSFHGHDNFLQLTARRRTLGGSINPGDMTPAGGHDSTTPKVRAAPVGAVARTLPHKKGSPTRTQLGHSKPAPHATPFYKGGGGLRSITPAPGKAATGTEEKAEQQPARASSVMSKSGAASKSPERKHKFAT